jgi:protein-tyrosine phosphatase
VNTPLYDLLGPWAGRLAIASRPRGREWLEDDLRALRAAGVDILVSALTADEVAELGLDREARLCDAIGIEYVSFPIVDRAVPASVAETADLVRRIGEELSLGKVVAIHCRSGIGRSTILAACVLAAFSVPVDEAFVLIEAARGCAVPDTPEQRDWVQRYATEVTAFTQRAAS